MNDSSFLKASNIGKINKELSELKSRKVLSDMLDKYIDSNEELTTENTILKENQRRLVTLLETKVTNNILNSNDIFILKFYHKYHLINPLHLTDYP